jgi:hypothetical protein
MSALDRLEHYIPLESLINCVLVQGDVRPGAIIYPNFDCVNNNVDLDHYNILLLLLKTCFSDLSYVIQRDSSAILISKINHSNTFGSTEFGYNSRKLGKMLGYPGYKEFNYICNHSEKKHIQYNVSAKFLNGKKIHILGNIGLSMTKYWWFKRLAQKATKILKENDLFCNSIDRVVVDIVHVYPVDRVVDCLQKNKNISRNFKYSICRILTQLSFSIKISDYKFDYNNYAHRNILITMLTHSKNNVSNLVSIDEEIYITQLDDVILQTKL